MKSIKNKKYSIFLIFSIIIGMIIGLIFKEKTKVLKPFGDLFLNMLLVIIIPLIFTTITTSIGKINSTKKVGKILITIIFTFIITSIISVLIAFIFTRKINLIDQKNNAVIKEEFNNNIIKNNDQKINYLEKTINTISVDNFNKLLSNENIISLILFSILFGIAINLSKEKGKKALEVIESFSNVIEKLLNIIMLYAPIGLSCYFACLIGTFGITLAKGFTKLFIIYIIIFLFMYFIIYPLYAYISFGKKGLKSYINNILPPTLCAFATCSSAASISVNTKAAKKIGVNPEIADTMIPLGTSFHKDGSIIGSVFKIMFLICLFNSNVSSFNILIIALLATLLVTAVPIGGGTISETLIITMLGFPLASLPILTIIATIIDAPATVLNVVGDTASSMIATKIINKEKK